MQRPDDPPEHPRSGREPYTWTASTVSFIRLRSAANAITGLSMDTSIEELRREASCRATASAQFAISLQSPPPWPDPAYSSTSSASLS